MTTLFGCICNQPKRIARALEPVRGCLVSPGPVPRWGLGYVQSGHVLLSRNPRIEETGVDFYDSVDSLVSDYVIGWASGDDGLRGGVNTQPFRYRSWLYAQSATVRAEDGALLAHIPGYLQRNIKGKTQAEHIFHLFLALLHDAGKIGDPNLDLGIVRHALRDTTKMVESTGERTRTDALGNVILSNSRSMLVARFGGPLWFRHLKETDTRVLEPDRYRAVIALASPTEPGEGFEEIPQNSVLAIHRDVRAEIVGVDS